MVMEPESVENEAPVAKKRHSKGPVISGKVLIVVLAVMILEGVTIFIGMKGCMPVNVDIHDGNGVGGAAGPNRTIDDIPKKTALLAKENEMEPATYLTFKISLEVFNDERYFEENEHIFGPLPPNKVVHFRELIKNGTFEQDDKDTIWDYFEVFVSLADKYKKFV